MFGTTWGSVNDDQILFFGMNNAFKYVELLLGATEVNMGVSGVSKEGRGRKRDERRKKVRENQRGGGVEEKKSF